MRRINWKWIVALICVAWLAMMAAASYLSYEQKTPVRIEKWSPQP